MGIYEYKYNKDRSRFWTKYSKPDPKKKSIIKPWAWTAIVQDCRQEKQQIDKKDADEARNTLAKNSKDYVLVFEYRKGGNTSFVTEKDAAIARKYRALRQRPTPWDSQQDDGQNEEGDPNNRYSV
jgi:hypothetical protein